MVQKNTYTKSQRPHGNTTLGLEGKPTNRINTTAVQPSIEPRSNTAWQHHLNNGGRGLEEERGRDPSWSGVTFWVTLFHSFFTFLRCSFMRVHFFFSRLFSLSCPFFSLFFSLFSFVFHSYGLVVFSRFWLKTANFRILLHS